MTAEEYAAALRSVGFGDADFRKLDTPAVLPDTEVCSLEVRIDGAVPKLPDDRRGAFARYVLAR